VTSARFTTGMIFRSDSPPCAQASKSSPWSGCTCEKPAHPPLAKLLSPRLRKFSLQSRNVESRQLHLVDPPPASSTSLDRTCSRASRHHRGRQQQARFLHDCSDLRRPERCASPPSAGCLHTPVLPSFVMGSVAVVKQGRDSLDSPSSAGRHRQSCVISRS